MTGQEVYEFYLVVAATRDYFPCMWVALPENQRQAWDDVADLLCPEMSDEAKEIMK